MRKIFPVVSLAVLFSLQAQVSTGADAAAKAPAQRVSGIITISDQRRIAVIERPDGEFVMVRAGDMLGEGRVEEITAHWLRIRYADGDRRLWVAGFRAQEVKSPLVREREDTGIAYNRTLDREKSIRRFDELAAADSTSDADISGLLAPMLDLPADARIVAIDHEPYGSVREGMVRIRDALAAGSVVRLSIDGVYGKEGVYLMPDPEPAALR